MQIQFICLSIFPRMVKWMKPDVMQWGHWASGGCWHQVSDKIFIWPVRSIILKYEIWFSSFKSVSLAIIHIYNINEVKNFQNTTIVMHILNPCIFYQSKKKKKIAFLHQNVFCLKLLWKCLSCLAYYRIFFSLLKEISWHLWSIH